MNQNNSTLQITALALLSVFVVAVYASESAFEKVSRSAQRQAYRQAAALELTADAQCQPAGPGKCTGAKGNGKDGCPCQEAQSGSPGICTGGMCKGKGNAGQSAGEAAKGLMDLLSKLAEMFKPKPKESTPPPSNNPFQTEVTTPSLLDRTTASPLDTVGGLDPIDLAFGTAGSESVASETHTDDSSPTDTTDDTGGEEDSITTRYETVGTKGEGDGSGANGQDNTTDGSNAFEDELRTAGLDDSGPAFGVDDELSSGGLTTDELELLALEAFARQNNTGAQGGALDLPYGQLTPDEVRRLQTLGYSTVSGELNPLSGFGGTGQAPAEAESTGVIGSIVNFFKRIFGLGAPQ